MVDMFSKLDLLLCVFIYCDSFKVVGGGAANDGFTIYYRKLAAIIYSESRAIRVQKQIFEQITMKT